MITDVSSLTSSSMVNSAKGQLSGVTNNIKQTILSKTDELNHRLQEVGKERVKILANYEKDSKQIQINYDNKQISEDEKNSQYKSITDKKDKELKLNDEKAKKIKDDISKLIKDPYKKAKDLKKKINDKINKDKSKSSSNGLKADTKRLSQVASFPQPPTQKIATVLMSLLTSALIALIQQQKGELQDLINKTNDFIDNALTPDTISQAIILRDNASRAIDSQEAKLNSIKNTLETIQVIIEILTIVIEILTALLPLFPAAKPIIDLASAIISAINAMLGIIIPILQQAIDELDGLKAQLHDINNLLDGSAVSSSSTSGLSNLLNSLMPSSPTNFPSYKGFTFAIKEEENPKFAVRGNKRHYAVALDTNRVPVLKSDYSFTQDPNDLIEQLKLIIDQQNLQA